MAEWTGSGPTPTLTLTDDQVLVLAKVLNAFPATVFSPHLANDAEFVDMLAARATISTRADVVIHESRSSRR